MYCMCPNLSPICTPAISITNGDQFLLINWVLKLCAIFRNTDTNSSVTCLRSTSVIFTTIVGSNSPNRAVSSCQNVIAYKKPYKIAFIVRVSGVYCLLLIEPVLIAENFVARFMSISGRLEEDQVPCCTRLIGKGRIPQHAHSI